MTAACGHLGEAKAVTPESPDSCPECVAHGDRWVHLPECQTCGHVGCCDSSKNSTRRRTTARPGTHSPGSYEPGEAWWWCCDDEVAFEIEGRARPARPWLTPVTRSSGPRRRLGCPGAQGSSYLRGGADMILTTSPSVIRSRGVYSCARATICRGLSPIPW